MSQKVTANVQSRLIVVEPGVTALDTQSDLYSALKEVWRTNANGEMRVDFPFRTIGGDPVGGGLSAGAYFFLRNDLDWRIRPQEANHELTITGNLFGESTDLPLFVPTLGAYTVSLRLASSSLTQVVNLVSPSTISTVIWEAGIEPETGYSAAMLLRLIASVLLGPARRVGGNEAVVTFKSITGTKNRVVAQVNRSNGSRDPILLDGS